MRFHVGRFNESVKMTNRLAPAEIRASALSSAIPPIALDRKPVFLDSAAASTA